MSLPYPSSTGRRPTLKNAAVLENADLIYFSGGNPGYLYETMKDTRAWNAAQRAWAAGCGGMQVVRQGR